MIEPIVTIKNGKLCGKIARDHEGVEYYSFQGIPYAKPPIGQLRFKAPQPFESWEGIKNVTEDRKGCFCFNRLFQSNGGSEDCLFLNVYTRELPKKNTQLKPVMFSVHGGAYVMSSGRFKTYGPNFLLKEDVVMVSFNYRTGLLGFLNFEDPSLEVTGNAGLKDQILALKWVQENIAKFNGDPNNVTIFGISAGGSSVHYLILSSLAKGLFHKAIMQSGCVFVPWARGHQSMPYITKALKIKTTNEKEVLEIIQKMSSEELIELQNKIPDDFEASNRRCFGPVVENKLAKLAFLSEEPEDIIKQGNYNHVPIITGFTSREGLFAELYSKEPKDGYNIKSFENKVHYSFTNSQTSTELSKTIANKIKSFYYGNHETCKNTISQYYLLQGDATMVWPTITTVKQHIATLQSPIYLYKFSVDTKLNSLKQFLQINYPGAAHGDDCGYVYSHSTTPGIIPNSIEETAIKRITALLTNFAKYGNPNSPTNDPLLNITWKPVDGDTLHFLDIGENLTVGINPEEPRMKFWEKIASLSV